jgi:hypothetical protein
VAFNKKATTSRPVQVSEHERIIGKVLGRHLLRGFHHLERVHMARLRHTGLAVCDRKSYDESHMNAAKLIPNDVLPI